MTVADGAAVVVDGILKVNGSPAIVNVYTPAGLLVAASNEPVSEISLKHLASGMYIVVIDNVATLKIKL